MLYPTTKDITKNGSVTDTIGGQIHSRLEIYFEECLIGRNL